MTDPTARTINVDTLCNLWEDGDAKDGWIRVGVQYDHRSRWMDCYHLVLLDTTDDTLWGAYYEEGLTENQESRVPWEEEGITVYGLVRMYPQRVKSITYTTAPPPVDSANPLKAAAQKLAFARLAADALARQIKTVTAELQASMEDAGVRTMDPKDAAGNKLATISLVGGRRTVAVDQAALLLWTRATHPTEIREQVNPAYEQKLKTEALTAGVGIDQATGQRLDFLTITDGTPGIRVELSPDAALATWDWDDS